MSGKVVDVQFKQTKRRGRGSRGMSRNAIEVAERRMEEMFGMALDVVYDELELGNPRVATWFAEQYLKKNGHRISKRMKFNLRSTRDLEHASQKITLAAANGEISFEDCKQLQEALARHAVLSGIRSIEELKGQLDEVKERTNAPKHSLNGYTPTWGRLSEVKNA